MSELKLAIIDNFYPQPWDVRRFALSLPFEDATTNNERTFYKGLLTTPDHPYANLGVNLLANALQRKIYWKTPIGEFRLLHNIENQQNAPDPRTWIHFDSNVASYAGIVYLNPEEQCDGGTNFYRHKFFGWDRFPEFNSPEMASACQQHNLDVNGVVQRLIDDGFEVEKQWDLVTQVPMKFNRCVIFDGQQFHARDGVFGNSAQDGRLTQNFFFEVVEDNIVLQAV